LTSAPSRGNARFSLSAFRNLQSASSASTREILSSRPFAQNRKVNKGKKKRKEKKKKKKKKKTYSFVPELLAFRVNKEEAPFGKALEVHLKKAVSLFERFSLVIEFETSPNAMGLQWLDPSLTEGKKHP
jgi:hypothetical protein